LKAENFHDGRLNISVFGMTHEDGRGRNSRRKKRHLLAMQEREHAALVQAKQAHKLLVPCRVRRPWLEARIDGRRRVFASGPRSKDGGFGLRIYNRDRGEIAAVPIHIRGTCSNGNLTICIDDGGTHVFRKEALR